VQVNAKQAYRKRGQTFAWPLAMEVNTYCEVNKAGHPVYNNPIQQLAVRVPLAGYWLTQKLLS